MSLDDATAIKILGKLDSDLENTTEILIFEDAPTGEFGPIGAAFQPEVRQQVTTARTLVELSELLSKERFSVAIIDNDNRDDRSGLAALRLVNQSVMNELCATIVVSSEAENGSPAAALKSGYSDLVLKGDLSQKVIRQAVKNAIQKSALRIRATEAGRKLVNLRAALRQHNELSASLMRPLMKRSLAQINALEFTNSQSGQPNGDLRLDIIAENCREMLKVCDTLERDGELANESLNLPPHRGL